MFGTGQGLGDFGIGDLFETFFGSEMRRREPRGPMRGADLRMEIEVDLIDTVRGGDRTIRVPRLETCAKCDGSGAEPGSNVSSCATCGGRGVAAGRLRPEGEHPLGHGHKLPAHQSVKGEREHDADDEGDAPALSEIE